MSGPGDVEPVTGGENDAEVANATAQESEASLGIPLYSTSLPDGTSVYCPLPWLVTGYGRLNQCTNLIRGPWGTFGKVGIYNRDLRRFAPGSDWQPVSDQHFMNVPDGAGYIRGFATLATGFGPVMFVTKYISTQAEGLRGNWGNYNEAVRRYFPASNDWWPTAPE